MFRKFLTEQHDAIQWQHVLPPPPAMIHRYEDLSAESLTSEGISQLLSRVAIVKFNGGLGTTMGCVVPQSTMEVRDELSFLDLAVAEVRELNAKYNANVPLVLMNSFNTEKMTSEVIGKYPKSHVRILTFEQSKHPRFWKDSLLPVPSSATSPIPCWCPPGHGDVYFSLEQSGLLNRLREEGREVLFVSNINNAGAVLDLQILSWFLASPAEFLMEVTKKTPSDVKGGTLVSYHGLPRLLEFSQVPDDHKHEFREDRFSIFNTNNLWYVFPPLGTSLLSPPSH
jgi:UTP--glucose-1-phosphate uridylyltransferase